jgi:hypothetical protein
MKHFDAVCTSSFDPCFGRRIIREGNTVTVNVYVLEGHEDIRVVRCSNGETFQGAGMRISRYELERSFRVTG